MMPSIVEVVSSTKHDTGGMILRNADCPPTLSPILPKFCRLNFSRVSLP